MDEILRLSGMLPRLTESLTGIVSKVTGVSLLAADPPTVVVDYSNPPTPDEVTRVAAIVNGFDWSDSAHRVWTARRAVAEAVAQTLTGMNPANISDRVALRYILTLLNDVRERVGMPRILEADHVQGLESAVQLGAGEPLGG